jgi:hypothetical protein
LEDWALIRTLAVKDTEPAEPVDGLSQDLGDAVGAR